MDIRPLKIDGAFEITPRQFADDRGAFMEWYRHDLLEEAVGHRLTWAQSNMAVSRRGVLRGIHWTDVPPGQAKYAVCPRGAILDVVVDVRVGSPTFGEWDAVVLDDVDRRAVYLEAGLGHAMLSLTDETTGMYLCSTGYAPTIERAITPHDPELAVDWRGVDLVLSDKDADAPTLAELRASGLLPDYEECRRFTASLSA